MFFIELIFYRVECGLNVELFLTRLSILLMVYLLVHVIDSTKLGEAPFASVYLLIQIRDSAKVVLAHAHRKLFKAISQVASLLFQIVASRCKIVFSLSLALER